ncbi:uncharacterized protein LOC121051350 [Rosa chinensis]|uniref:uncharacterized protein LOC121051350 n=1 Tax=Rosa chinensis TaxID=74649 RepID=UPI001AD94698|nr:uncharacterized protein LOC121051350 [Rosa chinensis]
MKEKAAINVNNRKQKKISHTTGTLTYAAKIYQWQVENNKDAPPNRKERFKITHLKKGSKTQYIDEASTQAVLSLEQKEAEKRNQNIDITLEVVEDIYAEVFGVEKRNRVRGMGTGYTWSDVPFIHTEKRGISKEVEALRAAVEEQKKVSERASMEQISQVSSSQGETSMPQMQSALPDEALA